MKLRPLGDKVLIRRIKEEDTMRNGLFIPDSVKEKPQEGEVIAVGTGRPNAANSGPATVPMSVKVGDRVLFGKYSGSEIEIDGEKLLIVREEEIQGVLEN
jgi:chaperonin GroES